MKQRLERNIWLLCLISSLNWMRFFIPVLALFYIASQVPLEQFTIIMGVFSLAILLLEVPSGVIADLVGRKTTIALSCLCFTIELILIAFYNGFWIFLVAKIISGIGVSLYSGADQAFLYDSLKKLKREKDYKNIAGICHMIENVVMAVTFIIGAYLFTINAKLPALLSIPFAAISFLLCFFLTEPYKSSKGLGFKQAYVHLKEGMTYFWHHSYVKYLVLYSWPIAATIAMMRSLSSVYHEAILIPISLMGIIVFVGSMLTAYAAKKTQEIEEKHGERKMMLYIQLAMIFAVFGMSLMIDYIGVAFYWLICFGTGFFNVLINHYTNKHIETSHRATMLSIKNFFDNLAIFVFFPVLGYVTKAKSMSLAFTFWGILLVFFVVGLWIYARILRMDAHRRKCS
ncbi:MFS transporter [Candidatus Woesearchaeota archaeon]|nr:MFS transporter [Candidatus Woesearchaeota archaeon]